MEFVIFIVVLILLFIPVCYLIRDNKQPTEPTITTKFKGEEDMQAQFKEAYLWACDVFGVRENVYDNLNQNLKKRIRHKSLGVRWFTYGYVSRYTFLHYPMMPRIPYEIKCENNELQVKTFVTEFIALVDSYRNNLSDEDIELFLKYNINYQLLLTTRFEVDTMQLYQLPNY